MKYIVIVFFSGMTLILNGCEQAQRFNIIGLVDFSSRDSTLIDWYKVTFHTSVIGNLGPKDRLTLLPIDYNSQTAGTELFRIDFSRHTYTNEFAGLQADEVEKKNHQDSTATAMARFDQSFDAARKARMALPEGTDIFGALRQVQKYVIPGYKTVLVITSDMLQFTDKVNMNFEAHLNTVEEIDRYLSIVEKADLTGIQVIVLTGPQPTITPQKFNAVKGFWQQYFTLCNGRLIDYSSGSVSKVEQVISH